MTTVAPGVAVADDTLERPMGHTHAHVRPEEATEQALRALETRAWASTAVRPANEGDESAVPYSTIERAILSLQLLNAEDNRNPRDDGEPGSAAGALVGASAATQPLLASNTSGRGIVCAHITPCATSRVTQESSRVARSSIPERLRSSFVRIFQGPASYPSLRRLRGTGAGRKQGSEVTPDRVSSASS